MPTALPSGEKNAFIGLVNVSNPMEATALQSLLVNYEDIAPIGIGRNLGLFIDNLPLLREGLAVFTDSNLQAVGIYNNKGSFQSPINTTLTNPVLIVNSYYSGGVSITANQMALGIFGVSSVNAVTISTNINLTNLIIGSGSNLDILDSSASGALVNNISILFANSTPAFLNLVKYGSAIGTVYVAPGSYYGGILNIDPDATCTAGPVTGLAAGEITDDSIVLQWTPPASGYIYLNVFYKKTESAVWIQATEDDGDFIQQAGFVFRDLEKDTYYDFQIQVICNNGGIANATISAQTTCCGSGMIVPATECLATVSIASSPTGTITLCNGVQIDAQYTPGATLTIPYFANKNIIGVIIIDNVPYQNLPFNKVTGTWTATGTSLVSFQVDNVISILVMLPVSG